MGSKENQTRFESDFQLLTKDFVGMTGLEPATTRPPDVYSTT